MSVRVAAQNAPKLAADELLDGMVGPALQHDQQLAGRPRRLVTTVQGGHRYGG